MEIDLQQLGAKAQALATEFGIDIIAALAIFIIGRWVANLITKGLRRLMERANVDATLIKFLSNIVRVLLLIFVILAAIGQLGIQTTSLIAVLGAAGLAVGLALQGSLSNFAAGVLVIIFRPYKVGDYIEGAGVAGTVDEVQIFNTVLKTPDNVRIIVPNSQITGGIITNYSAHETRRVDFTFGIGYADDIDKAKKIIEDVLTSDERVFEDPAPQIVVAELADSSVNIVARPWSKAADYWSLKFDVTETVKKRFDAEGISIPFPQRDVHVYYETPQKS
ncbi:MAG TPA: mechanosensitive ion channel domain-containing protein [Woeseiaceae bacterium]|nr:mechanosensitive ion channel domain-containing protein [Woeseiaceae bacterium]